MPVPKKDDSSFTHHLVHVALLLLNLICLPFSASITVSVLLLRKFGLVWVSRRKFPHDAPRVLVSGIGMSKGLFVARSLYLGGCKVFGADTDNNGNLYSGRFSSSLQSFFPLPNPITDGLDKYISTVITIVRSENIDLWVSCSRVATPIEDAKLAKALLEQTNCKVFQFDEHVTSVLDDKISFMKKTSELGLVDSQWFSLANVNEIHDIVAQIKNSTKDSRAKRYMIKSAKMDDATRDSLPLLNSNNLLEVEQVLRSLDLSQNHKWIIQEFIESGEEYCTHALVVNGRVRAFAACPSESVMLHYEQVNTDTILHENLLQFTEQYAKSMGNITGHLSFDFLISYQKIINGFVGSLIPIECNPRCHTATVVFHGREAELTDCYLETIFGERKAAILQPRLRPHFGFYWIAHDLVVFGAIPIFRLLSGMSFSWTDDVQRILKLLNHLLTWKDPTFEWWDPVPWFVLNHIYWPWEIASAYLSGMKWRKINVSTGKIFKK